MARPPPSGDAEPDLIEFGIPVVDDRLEEADLEFPASRAAVVTAVGDVDVPVDAHGHTVSIEAALAEVDAESFETRHDLLDALHPVLEARRQASTLGLVGRLRSYLPF